MGEVIQFPLNGKRDIPSSEEERQKNIKRYQAELALNTSIELTYQLFEEIEARGIKLRDKELDQDLLMVCESLKSALLKASGAKHPLQSIVKQVVNPKEGEIFSSTWQDLYKDKEQLTLDTRQRIMRVQIWIDIMILVDLNQVMISNLMAQLHSRQSKEVDEELLRHMVLNGIRSYRTKFFEEYGEIVICLLYTSPSPRDQA